MDPKVHYTRLRKDGVMVWFAFKCRMPGSVLQTSTARPKYEDAYGEDSAGPDHNTKSMLNSSVLFSKSFNAPNGVAHFAVEEL